MDELIGEDWILAQPEAKLLYPGSKVLAADSRNEVDAVPGDPAQTSAYSRTILRAADGREDVEAWYHARLGAAGWRLAKVPKDHPQHWRRYRRKNEAFNLFFYDRSPFTSDLHGIPGPSAFRTKSTVYQVFYEARAAGYTQ